MDSVLCLSEGQVTFLGKMLQENHDNEILGASVQE